MKRKTAPVVSNTKIAIVFFVFLAFVIGISLTSKLIALIGASQFDDSRRFTLSITNGKSTEIMSFSPVTKNVVIFKFDENANVTDAGKLLKVPIDGSITHSSLDLDIRVDALFINTILNYGKIKTNLTVIDLIRLTVLAKATPESAVNIKRVGDPDGLDLDNLVGYLVSDPQIEKDNQTIKIVNGAGVSGLGNRLARLITNMGGNVIIVATSDSPVSKSFISYIDDKTYTVNRLEKILGYKATKGTDNAVSDITITIGEDKVNASPF